MSASGDFRAPRKIAVARKARRNLPRLIPLCSRFESYSFTSEVPAADRESNFSRWPSVSFLSEGQCRMQPFRLWRELADLGRAGSERQGKRRCRSLKFLGNDGSRQHSRRLTGVFGDRELAIRS